MERTKEKITAIAQAKYPVAEIGSITKKVHGRTLLKNVSFTVELGEICGLLGPNGAGKTTLIRALTGLIRPDAGDILIGGRIFEKFYREESARPSDAEHRNGGAHSGLGLFIARTIVRKHGGEIAAYNRLEGGAVVRFSVAELTDLEGAEDGTKQRFRV